MDMVKCRLWATISVFIGCCSSTFAASAPTLCGMERQAYTESAAKRFQLPQSWVRAVMYTESGGCEFLNGVPITSEKGAMGLMQLMPSTWATYREKLNLGDDPYDPYANILAGAAYLKSLNDRFGWPGAAAAYHAGPSRYELHLETGRELPPETVEYMTRIDRFLDASRSDDHSLFVSRPESSSIANFPSKRTLQSQIFVALRRVQSQAPSIVERSSVDLSDQISTDSQRPESAEEWKAR